MRYKNLIGFVWVAVIMGLFTSCLKDINNVYNPGTTAAVVRQHGDSALMMANTRFGWIYSTKLSSYSEGKCLLVSFDYDPNLPENTGAEQKRGAVKDNDGHKGESYIAGWYRICRENQGNKRKNTADHWTGV